MRSFYVVAIFLHTIPVVGMVMNTGVSQTALMGRIDSLLLLPDGSLADKNIVSDISVFSQGYLHSYDHERLVGILVEDSKKNASAFKVYATYIAIESQCAKAVREGLFGTVQGEKQFLSAQAPIAYEVYIAIFKKIAELKKRAGPLL